MLPCQQVSGMWNLDSVQPVALRGSLGLCLLLIGFHQSSFRDWTMTCSLPLPVCHLSYPSLHTCTQIYVQCEMYLGDRLCQHCNKEIKGV
ncbi:hypothetical protein NQZ68_036518 [Dissostichus eleginoides]|nr:hypothetical protein NQZ68_036518 [Dissostichus eleginoides]